MSFELAQVNVGRLAGPIDGPQLAAFMAALDPVNAVADAAPGFVWRLQTDEGNATAIEAFGWDATPDCHGVIVNMSVWTDVDALAAYVYGTQHRAIMKRRREFFLPMAEAFTACWWVAVGHRPSTSEAEDRVRHVREHGPTTYAFTMRTHFPAPTDEAAEPRAGQQNWFCHT